MGIETALLAMGVSASTASAVGTGLTVFSGISSVLGGLQGMQEGKAQSANAMAQASMAGKEAARVAAKEADFERQNMEDTVRRQKLAYMAGGVSLSGSPLLVMEETRRKGQENIDEIIAAGGSSVAAINQEGRTTAARAKSAGRKEFISGITSAGQTFARLGK